MPVIYVSSSAAHNLLDCPLRRINRTPLFDDKRLLRTSDVYGGPENALKSHSVSALRNSLRIFIALHGMRRGLFYRKAVCPSARLSVRPSGA